MRKLISIVATSALLFNSLIAPLSIFAQEASVTPEPTPEATPIVEESVAPKEEPAVTPIETPNETTSPTPEIETPSSLDSLSSVDNSPVEEQVVSESSATLSTNDGEIEKVCLTDEEIKDTQNEDWDISLEGGYAETKERVQLGVKYVFPQENKVSVTFKCLPKDENLRTKIKIQQVKVSDLNLPEEVKPYGEYAYDITTGMTDETFEYDVTLPKAPDSNSEISYIEKTIDQAKEGVRSEDLREIDSSKIEQGENTVKAIDIDHFTIYVTTYADLGLTLSETTYLRGDTVYTKANISGGDLSRYYRVDVIEPNNTVHNINSCQTGVTPLTGSYVLSTSAQISTNWKAQISSYTLQNDCDSRSSPYRTSNQNFEVKSTNPVPIANPVLSQTCGLDIALVIDNSNSINSSELSQMKSALKGFVSALAGTPTQFSVTKFGTNASVVHTFTSDTTDINSAIDAVATGGGGTNWKEAIATARGTFDPRVNKPNLMIFASDGNPTFPDCGGSSTCPTDVNSAVTEANTTKQLPIRILALGIGDELSVENLKAISGHVVNASTILNSDVVTTDFSTMATQLANFATQTCGGTITVNKYIGSVGTSNRAGTDWTFNIGGNSKTTDVNGQTEATTLTAGSSYSVTETNLSAWPGYSFSSAVCKNQAGAAVGTGITNGVGSIVISDNDIISCDFVNTTPSSSLNWPSDWETPNSCISDIANDENPNSTDLIGDPTTPAVGFKVDSTYAYFRERVNGNPAGSGGLDQYAWVVLFQTSKPQYQYLFSLNGKDEKVQLWQNTSPAGPVDFSPLLNDPAETLLWSQDAYLYSRIMANPDGSYYVDWAIPLTELQSRGIDPSVTKFFATSANENNYNKDHLNCYNNLCDIGVNKTDSADPVYKGDAFSYTITVTNTGSDTAENVVVSDTLPANFSLTSVSSSQGSCTSLPCNLGSIASGASATVTITGSGTVVGTLTNVASANTSTLDIDLTNNSDSEDTLVNEKNGNIVIVKQTIPDGNSQTFEFDPSWSVSNFSLTDGGQNSNSLVAGTYSITETEPTGWKLTDVSCVSSIKDAETADNLELDAGETITCTFTNTKLPKLTVVKSLSPVTDPGLFDLQIDNTTYAPNIGNGGSTGAQMLSIGQHSVNEIAGTGTSLSDYNTTYSSNCPGGVITLAAGDDETCTITNIRKTGNIIIDKYVSGGSAQPSDWTFVISTILGAIGSYHDGDNPILNTGSYTITETGPEGYTLTEVSGTCTKIASDSGILLVTEAGGTCTFKNTRDTGSVKVNKQFDSNADGTYESGNAEANVLGFAWKLDSGTNTAMGTPINDVETTVGSTTHSVNEYNPGNYHFTGWYTNGSRYTCTSPEGTTLPISINVEKDITTEITLCNARDVGSITVEKDVVPNDSSTWDFTVTSVPAGYQGNISLSDGGLHTFTNLPTGDYLIAETAGAGTNASQYIPTFSGDCVDREATPPGLYIHIESGESKSCKITNTKKAKVIVSKVTNPTGSVQSFHFNGNYTAGFDLKDTETNDSGWMDYHSPYYVSEDPVTDWSLSNISCVESVNQNSIVSLSSNKVDITLEPGEIITCTFTNTKLPKLTVTKTIINHGLTYDQAHFAPYGIDTNTIVLGQPYTLSIGSHVVTETTDPNYNVSFGGACDSGGNVTLVAGDNATCTITNEEKSTHLTLIKTVTNDNGGNATPTDWTLSATGPTNISGKTGDASITNAIVNSGAYDLSESGGIPGYTAGATWSCVINSGRPVSTNSVSLVSGDNAICTLNNNDIAPSLTLNKVVVNNNGGTQAESAWTIKATNRYFGTLSGTGKPGENDVVSGPTLLAGTYLLEEVGPTGYSASPWTCTEGVIVNPGNQITLGLGQSTVCSITNDDIQPKLTVTKIINGGSAQVSDFLLYVGGTQVTSGVQNGYNVGTYRVTESGLKMSSYTEAFSGDCNANGYVTLNLGDVKNCTITNTRDTATLRVLKNVDLNGDGDYADSNETNATDWQWATSWLGVPEYDHSGNTGDPAITVYTGQYNLDEVQKPGFHLVSLTCNASVANNRSVIIGKDQNVVCTFTNARDTGTITIVKNAIGGNDTFGFTVDGDGTDLAPSITTTGGTGTTGAINVVTGDYSVSESSVPSGWDATSASCRNAAGAELTTSFSVGVGENITCTFTNTKLGKITIEKQTLPDGISGSFEFYSSWGNSNFFLADDEYKDSWLIPGTYSFNEMVPPGWVLTDTVCTSSIGDRETYGNLELDSGETITCVFTNTKIAPPLYVSKFEDSNNNQARDSEENYLDNWTFEIYNNNTCTGVPIQTAITDSSVFPGTARFDDLYLGETYWIYEVEQPGWLITTGNCRSYTIHDDVNSNNQVDFGNQEDKFEVTIEKSNDKSGGTSAGNTVTYTLKVTNNGNRSIYNLDVKDFLPGGFSYITGTTTGDTTNDPTVSGGTLTWEDVDNELTTGETFTINYQVKIAPDVSDGIYKNYATCRGNIRSQKESIECDPDDSTVTIGSNLGYGGNLRGQVLGISTSILPATGNQTWVLIVAFASIALGVFLNIYARKVYKKKNDQK